MSSNFNRSSAIGLLAAALTIATMHASGVLAEDRPKTTAEVEALVTELSNWGRWGKDDQLGALNLITPEKRKQAAALVQLGTSVSLARIVEKQSAVDNPEPFVQTMLPNVNGGDSQWSLDRYSVAYHGYAHTHLDALCHLFYRGKMYNGFSQDEVGPKGAAKLSIINARSGVLTRGILFDIPRLRGVRFLEPATPIYPEDLDAWEKHAGLKVTSGDVIFIRTGRWQRRAVMGPWAQLDVDLVGDDREIRVGELLELGLSGFDDARVRVADVQAAHAAGEVDERVPVDVGEGGTVCLRDHDRRVDRERIGDDAGLPLEDRPGLRPGELGLQMDCARNRHQCPFQ